MKHTIIKLYCGSGEPHPGNDSEPDEAEESEHSHNQNCPFPPLKLTNLMYFKKSLFFSLPHA